MDTGLRGGSPSPVVAVAGAGTLWTIARWEQGESHGHSQAGHCSQNSLGVSIFSVQRTGQLYGSGNKAASVCHPRGWGRGGRQSLEPPPESQELWQGQAAQEPPTLFPWDGESKLLPLRLAEPHLGMARGHRLHSAAIHPACHPGQGCALGIGSYRSTFAPSLAYKYLLRP